MRARWLALAVIILTVGTGAAAGARPGRAAAEAPDEYVVVQFDSGRAIEDLGHPELVIALVIAVVVIVVVAASPARAGAVVVLRRTTLFDTQQRQVEIAAGTASGRGQHGGSRSICA